MNPRSIDCEADAQTPTPSRRLLVNINEFDIRNKTIITVTIICVAFTAKGSLKPNTNMGFLEIPS